MITNHIYSQTHIKHLIYGSLNLNFSMILNKGKFISKEQRHSLSGLLQIFQTGIFFSALVLEDLFSTQEPKLFIVTQLKASCCNQNKILLPHQDLHSTGRGPAYICDFSRNVLAYSWPEILFHLIFACLAFHIHGTVQILSQRGPSQPPYLSTFVSFPTAFIYPPSILHILPSRNIIAIYNNKYVLNEWICIAVIKYSGVFWRCL